MLFAALLAVTLNLLQPMAHAVLMRDAGPGTLWSGWCKASAADPKGPASPDRGAPASPTAPGQYDCCLGLAYAPSLVVPSNDFVLLLPMGGAALVLLPAAQRPSIAIRDGPPRPRGPPFSLTT
ncbi:DUF2946 family protein [Reyranella sp.]|uniref:DUF2946 family protein n=1 Tax=Reyranella sp. TaxID=1929291 RepID=UPI003D0E3CA9